MKINRDFLPEKNEYKTRSEPRFQQNRQYMANFNLTTARHEKSTVAESGLNSNTRRYLENNCERDFKIMGEILKC